MEMIRRFVSPPLSFCLFCFLCRSDEYRWTWRQNVDMLVHPVTLIDRAFFLFGENLPMIMKTSKRAPGPLHSNIRLHQCSISSRHDLPRNVLHCILVGTFWKFLLICRQLLFFFLFINFFYRNAVFYHFSDINVIVHKPPSSWPRVSDPHHFSKAVRIGNSSLTKMIILCLSCVCVWGNYLDYWSSYYHTWWCIKCAFAEI